jgi:hypothetical protein
MNQRRFRFNCIVFFILFVLLGMLASCSDNDSSNPPPVNTESLRIYEMYAGQGSFTAVDDDGTATAFYLRISNTSDMLYFTNRGAQQAGYDTVDNVINNVWPRVYGADAPNAVMKATTADGDTIGMFCTLSDPGYNTATGELDFVLTYLEGDRPDDGLALTDVEMIIVNNAAEVETQEWSTLMEGDFGMLEPTGTEDVYTLYIEGVIGDPFDFTCAPQRDSRSVLVQDFVESWSTRFGQIPPNATLLYTPPDNPEGGAQVVVLTDPIYDGDADILSFRAEFLFGTAPIGSAGLTVNNPYLFIDGGKGGGFPTYQGNTFSIQFRNSTQKVITVWFDGAQPPCSEAEAANCNGGGDPANYSEEWKKMKHAFGRSGTHFYIYSNATKETREVDVSNQIHLKKGETLRVVPPYVNGMPQWYWTDHVTKEITTAGVNSWATLKGVNMPAVMSCTLMEYNLAQANSTVVGDLSAVDGLNANITMSLSGKGCGKDANCHCDHPLPKVCKTNVDAYAVDHRGKSNDGCPYIMEFSGAKVCPNPKHYPAEIVQSALKANWVAGSDHFTNKDVPELCRDVYKHAGSPTGLDMCSAASGLATVKPAYHIWWSTNPVGQGWLKYLQRNAKGKCDAYGWAYDEKRWVKGRDTCKNFDDQGNPPDNTAVNPVVTCSFKKDTYLNFDILKIMK